MKKKILVNLWYWHTGELQCDLFLGDIKSCKNEWYLGKGNVCGCLQNGNDGYSLWKSINNAKDLIWRH